MADTTEVKQFDRIAELEAKLAEVEAERDKFSNAWVSACLRAKTDTARAEAAEAALLAAYRLAWDAICGGEELTVVERADDNKERYFYRLGRADAINAALARFEVAMEANPTPTAPN